MVNADGHDRHALERDLHLGVDVDLGVTRDGEDVRHGASDPDLHAQETEPATLRNVLANRLGVIERNSAINRDGVVQRLEHGPAVFLTQLQNARTEALVVVDEIKLRATSVQDGANPAREGQGLPEAGRTHDQELGPVGPGLEFAEHRHAEGVGVAVEVETGHGGETHALVQLGPGLPGEDFDAVAQRNQFPAEVTGVNTLTTAGGVAPVDQKRDTGLAVLGRSGGDARGHRDGPSSSR